MAEEAKDKVFQIRQSKHLTSIESEVDKLKKENLSKVAVDHVVTVEKERITEFVKSTVLKALTKRDELEKKIKQEDRPDNITHVSKGEGAFAEQKGYSNEKFQAVSKLYNEINTLTAAFDKAMESGQIVDFESLAKLLK